MMTLHCKDIPIQLIFDFPKSPRYTFENFIVCAGNEPAYKLALSFCRGSRISFNPLFFFGKPGLGKTHILKAIGNYFIEEFNNLKVLYISMYDILELYKNSVSYKEILNISKKYKRLDLLLLDDIHAIEDNYIMEDQIFHIYNELMDKGNRIVIAGRKSPKEMLSMQKHLQSRLLVGPVIKIGSITDETKKDILKKIARDEGVILSDKVADYILTHFSRDTSDIKNMFLTINKYSMSVKEKITIPLIKKMVNTAP